MQEMDAKRSTKLPQRESTEENDRADTSSDACQVGDTDGDVPVTQSILRRNRRRHLRQLRKLRYLDTRSRLDLFSSLSSSLLFINTRSLCQSRHRIEGRMQESSRELKHGDEHRVLSLRHQSATNVEM